MAHENWLMAPWFGGKDDDGGPFGSLRKQIDALFEDFGGDVTARSGSVAVRSNVSETDKAVCITAELPGVELEDIDISVTGNRITVKGEKKSEKEEKGEKDGRQFHRIERSAGSFHRSMALPFKIDPDSVKAEARNGVLTVTVPKPPEAVQETKKISIKKSK